MDAIQVLWSSLTLRQLVRGLAISFLLSRFLSPRSPSRREKGLKLTVKSRIGNDFITIAGFFSLFLFARSWLALVDRYVPEPYLDEVFHIPQAQTYCEGRYLDWDDKITTPPGLYLLSVASHKLWRQASCTPFSLRSNNLFATLLTALLAALCRDQIEARTAEQDDTTRKPKPKPPRTISLYSLHTALNIALFPVIFFFSALYYTDVVSTLTVLVAYRNHLGRVGRKQPGLLNDLWTVVLGVATLFMRQTNVFWVVVYMGGLEAVHAVRSLKPEPEEWPRFTTLEERVRFMTRRWSAGGIEDPGLDVSWPDDWLLCLLSIATAAVCNPARVLKQIWPHITILGLFAGFVAWNGGVVLGDKSNHIATIHLAQMLYIWPFFAFFSAPLFLPTILEFLQSPVTTFITLVCGKTKPSTQTQTSSPPPPQSLALRTLDLITINKIYYPIYLLLPLLLSLAIIKFNTIIHPFTLADNRHYMFYVFRYTILRSTKVRYLLVGAYTLSRWLVWRRLAGHNKTNPAPSLIVSVTDDDTSKTTPDSPPSTSTHPPKTSTILLWLLTTSLSLITAPLVEPRYFILPWVFFRLLVPAWHVPSASTSTPTPSSSSKSSSAKTPPPTNTNNKPLHKLQNGLVSLSGSGKVDLTLALETVWFVAINLGTMYMFLYRPFYWRKLDGSGELLDGGRVQRFMW